MLDEPITPEERARRGGIARAKKLTPKRRKQIAQKAAAQRWYPEKKGKRQSDPNI
jgi:hypothetical protein